MDHGQDVEACRRQVQVMDDRVPSSCFIPCAHTSINVQKEQLILDSIYLNGRRCKRRCIVAEDTRVSSFRPCLDFA